jgi:transcription elongation GreA/GreB family factor
MDFWPIWFHIARMNAILFDTLRLSRTLRDKGHFTPEQAEALAEALGEAAQGDLATKADLAAVKAELVAVKADLAKLEAKLEAKIAEAKADILKWVVGAIGFQTVVILGALVSLVRIFAK